MHHEEHHTGHPGQAQGAPVYTCPMHPEIIRDKPGRCPLCGMNLVPAGAGGGHGHEDHAAYDKHAGHRTSSFLKKFWISLVLTVPIFFYSEMARMAFGIRGPEFSGWQYVLLLAGSVIYFYGGLVFLVGAYREVRARLPGMMTLIAIAISAAYIYSLLSVLTGGMHELLFELGSLITIMLLGHWIEMKSVQGAQGALKELSRLLPDQAEVVRGNSTTIVPLSELVVGDIVLVKPGSKIPADGTVVEGRSDVNESIITGESRPSEKGRGDRVIAGSVNGDGSMRVKVDSIGEKTFLAGVMRLVDEAQRSKSRLQMLSDRAAYYLTIIAIIGGVITFAAWILAEAGLAVATERLVSVLVITCPHALGLAIPLVASISTTMAARNGLLIRQRIALEGARKIDTVLFDKTGTLTKGEFGVAGIIPGAGRAEDDVLRIAASIDLNSEHPLAQAIVKEAKKRGLDFADVKEFARVAGRGVRGRIGNTEMNIGNDSFLDEGRAGVGEDDRSRIAKLSKEGKTVIHVVADGKWVGSIALGDIIREESRAAIRRLKEAHIRTVMVTGDSEDVAAWVAGELGLDAFYAKVAPDQKAEKVRLLQGEGRRVAMVGDGVNDAPALTQADLGIAIGAGTNVAVESAGIVLVRNDPRDIPKILHLSRLTYAKMIQNLLWATGYNVVAVPLAAGVLASRGIILEPWFAAVLMSASTVIVAINAALLRRKTI